MTTIEWVRNQDGTQGVTWNPVRGFEGYYASQDGMVVGPSGRIMRPQQMPSGHLYVLCNRGKGKQRKLFIHRAVLLAFVGLPVLGQETRHLDGNPANNCLRNLAWGTRAENMNDRRRHGRMPIPHESKFTKLKPGDIPIIRRLRGDGKSSRQVAAMFGTSHVTIQKIWRGERWKGY